MAQQMRNVAGKFGGIGIGAMLGIAGLGYGATQSFYSGKYSDVWSISLTCLFILFMFPTNQDEINHLIHVHP